jgi:protein PhnA
MTDTDDAYVYGDATGEWIPASEAAAKTRGLDADTPEVCDSVGNLLANGDSVTLIKDLTVKSTNQTLKRGTVIRSIRLTGDIQEIDCRYEAWCCARSSSGSAEAIGQKPLGSPGQ